MLGAAQAQPFGSSGHLSNDPQEAAATATINQPSQASNGRGLPSYEMRPDGLMINGLLPAHRWQG
jgi:hypothetical protein